MTETYTVSNCSSGLSGWSVDIAVRLEQTSKAHIIHRLIRASQLERNAVLGALAEFCVQELEHKDTARPTSQKFDPVSFGQAVSTLSPKSLIEFIFGPPPKGFVGLMARLRGAPLERTLYRTLFEMFERGDLRARALQQTEGAVPASMVRLALDLEVVAVHPSTLGLIYRSTAADDLNGMIALIRRVCSGATDERISMSLSSLHKTQNVADWANRWLMRMDRLPSASPFVSDPEFKILITGQEMNEVGREFRNCLTREIRTVAVGRSVYAVSKRHGVIVEFVRGAEGCWVATNAWGHENNAPTASANAAVHDLLRRHGIPALLAPTEEERRALRLLSVFGGRDGITPLANDYALSNAA